jgi:soluble lytic murein transglycosylase-like protein
MKPVLTVLLLLAAAPSVAMAQQSTLLSPPERASVPLTEADQQKALAATLMNPGGVPVSPLAPATDSNTVRFPGLHISSGNSQIDGLVSEAAARYRLDPCLIISVMGVESRYNRLAVSPKGASGLMQLMPETAARFGVRNIFDPRENIMAGSYYLRWLLDRFGGNVRLALAGYNAGEGAVESHGFRIPPFLETQNYVQEIYARYSRIHGAPGFSLTPPIGGEPQATAPAQEKPPAYNQILKFDSLEPGTPKSSTQQL